MNPELIQALAAAGLLTDEQAERFAAGQDAWEDADFGDFEAALTEGFDRLRSGEIDSPTDETLGDLEQIVETVEEIRAGAAARLTAAAGRQSRLEQLATRLTVVPDAGATSPTPARGLPAIGNVAARRPRERRPVPTNSSSSRSRVLNAAQVELPDASALVAAFEHTLKRYRREMPNGMHTVATVHVEMPEERRLERDNPGLNMQRITAAVSPEVLTAAGGLCAPLTPRYDAFQIAVADRPLRDALPAFQADRGGIHFARPYSVADAEPAIGIWTEANDAVPGSAGPTTKPVLRIPCPDWEEIQVQAVTRILELGNWFDRTWDEGVQAMLANVMAAHARTAEQEIIADIAAASTDTSTEQTLGSTRDVLAVLERAAVAYRARHRMDDRAVLRAVLPSWLVGNMRADLTRNLPGDNKLGVTNEEFNEYLRVRSISPIYWMDDTSMLFDEAGGSLGNWPTKADAYLFAEGTFLFLDGGVLDLGVVRDSTLNASNDLQVFGETFEATAFVGLESVHIDMNICPSGEVSGTTDVTPLLCNTGS